MSCDNANIYAVSGTLVGISASLPATCNLAGFEALTYTNIGEVTDPGEESSPFSEVTHTPVATGTIVTRKGTQDPGSREMQLAIDRADSGQIIARAAHASRNNYSFRITYPDGTIDYFHALVMNFTTATGSAETIIAGTISLKKNGATFTATANPGPFTLTYTAGTHGTLLGSSPQTVALGASGSPVAAIADTGYDFSQWSDGSTDNPRIDIDTNDDITVTASFVAE